LRGFCFLSSVGFLPGGDGLKFGIIRNVSFEVRAENHMTSLPEYLIEFKSKVERRLGTVIDF
jgi:hypothetical protein